MFAMLVHKMRADKASTRWGATRAQADLAGFPAAILAAPEPVDLLLDFSGIEAVNGSYVRASVGWLLRCALLSRSDTVEEASGTDPWLIRPLGISALFVGNLSTEVRQDIQLWLRANRLPCLEALGWTKQEVATASVLGVLDTQLSKTLSCLSSCGGQAVADTLWKQFSDHGIGVTAWNTRLSELYSRLLVNRRKEGKFWRYFIPCKEVTNGIQIQTS
jgi:hypothetical protein